MDYDNPQYAGYFNHQPIINQASFLNYYPAFKCLQTHILMVKSEWAMKNNPYPTPLSWLVDGIPTMAYNLYAFVRILYDKRNSKPLIGYLPPISSETGDCSLLPHKSIPINQVLSGLSGNLG